MLEFGVIFCLKCFPDYIPIKKYTDYFYSQINPDCEDSSCQIKSPFDKYVEAICVHYETEVMSINLGGREKVKNCAYYYKLMPYVFVC